MPKVWFLTKRPSGEHGFSPVEVLLAAAVFAFMVMALIGAIIYGRTTTAQAGDRARAQALAEEGLEAVRNIRDSGFANLPASPGTYYLGQSGGTWTIGTTPEGTIDGQYTRQITVTNVDGTRKTITATVSWTTGGATRQVTATTRMTNWMATITPPVTSGPIMMAYSKNTTTPFYRIWDGTNWGAEGSANAVTGNINYIVLKSSRTRNEAVLGTQTSTGAIFVQVWNGTTWSTPTQVGSGPTTTRSFDISYEKNTDRALIAYSSGADFAYRTFSGTTPSTPTTVTVPPTTGTLNWLELRQNPLSSSNEIAMMMLDANADVYGMRWTGSAWDNMGVSAVWDNTAASATKKTIDVEYEQTSGRAMFMWGDSVITDQFYHIWNGTTLTATPQLLDIPAENGVAEWIQLAARPNSNEIMMGVQDAQADLNTRKWSGTAWDSVTQHAEHSATTENINSRNFDIIWETHSTNPGEAWIMWGNSTTVSAKRWTGTAWDTAGMVTALAGSDDTSFIRLRADPVSGTVFAGIYEDGTSATDDIWETRLTGGGVTWSAKNTIWAGPTTASPAFFRIDIATP